MTAVTDGAHKSPAETGPIPFHAPVLTYVSKNRLYLNILGLKAAVKWVPMNPGKYLSSFSIKKNHGAKPN